MHAQRTGTNVLQTPTYWTITIGLLNRYNGLKDFPAHIANFQHNWPKGLSWCPFGHTTLGPIDVWVDDEGAMYCCLLVCMWNFFGERCAAPKWASIRNFTNRDCLENYRYEQTKLEKHCNPSTSPIMTVEYDVIEGTVVPDPGARTRI